MTGLVKSRNLRVCAPLGYTRMKHLALALVHVLMNHRSKVKVLVCSLYFPSFRDASFDSRPEPDTRGTLDKRPRSCIVLKLLLLSSNLS